MTPFERASTSSVVDVAPKEITHVKTSLYFHIAPPAAPCKHGLIRSGGDVRLIYGGALRFASAVSGVAEQTPPFATTAAAIGSKGRAPRSTRCSRAPPNRRLSGRYGKCLDVGEWWDGWPPNSRVKRLFVQRKYFLIQFEGPKQGSKRSGSLQTSPDAPGPKARDH